VNAARHSLGDAESINPCRLVRLPRWQSLRARNFVADVDTSGQQVEAAGLAVGNVRRMFADGKQAGRGREIGLEPDCPLS